jgi:hypothetical protein
MMEVSSPPEYASTTFFGLLADLFTVPLSSFDDLVFSDRRKLSFEKCLS